MPGHLCDSLSRPMSFLCPEERSRRTLVPTESSPPPPCPSLQGWRHARDVSGIGAVRDFNASRSCAGRPIQPVPCFETPSRQAVCALDVQQQNHDDARQPTSQRSATSPLGTRFYPATPEVTLKFLCTVSCSRKIAKAGRSQERHSQPPFIIAQSAFLGARRCCDRLQDICKGLTNPSVRPMGRRNGQQDTAA